MAFRHFAASIRDPSAEIHSLRGVVHRVSDPCGMFRRIPEMMSFAYLLRSAVAAAQAMQQKISGERFNIPDRRQENLDQILSKQKAVRTRCSAPLHGPGSVGVRAFVLGRSGRR